MEQKNYDKIDWVLFIIRIVFGFRIFYGVADNVFSWEHMVQFEKFLASNGFPLPLLCAVTSVYAQFFSSLSWILGYQVRVSSLVMIINFFVAIIGFHVASGDSYLGMAPAIHLFAIAIMLYSLGSGKVSLDHFFKRS